MSLIRERRTWCRWDQGQLRFVTSHPYLWIHTDAEGVERCYSTKAEALAAIDMMRTWCE
jgi:hypothetical protein